MRSRIPIYISLLALGGWSLTGGPGSTCLAADALPILVAHRGASADAPENTLAAFRLAWEQKADAIEGDFRLTRDGKIVCIHDTTTERTTGKKTKLVVAQSSLAELRRLDVGTWKATRWAGEQIPTLSEVLQVVPQDKKIFIEIKCGTEIMPSLRRTLGETRLAREQITIISFKDEVIRQAKMAFPEIKAYWLTAYKRQGEDGPWRPTLHDVMKTLRRVKADGLDTQAHERVNAAFVEALVKSGFELHAWTIDDPAVARHWMRFGVQSITTNKPEYLRQQVFIKQAR